MSDVPPRPTVGEAAPPRPVVNEAPPRSEVDLRTEPLESDRSLSELFSSLVDDTRTLLAKEVQLAKVEIKEEARKTAKSGGLLGAGAFAGYMAVLLLSFALAWGLENLMDEGLAFLIVGVIWAIAATILGLKGKKKLAQVNAVPEQTKETLQEDVQWAKNQLH